MSNPNRVPEGSPEGGQFARGGAKPEPSGVSLSNASTDLSDDELATALEALDDDVDRRSLDALMIPGRSAYQRGKDENSWVNRAATMSGPERLEALRAAQDEADAAPGLWTHHDAGYIYGDSATDAPAPQVRKAILDVLYAGGSAEHRAETERLMDLSHDFDDPTFEPDDDDRELAISHHLENDPETPFDDEGMPIMDRHDVRSGIEHAVSDRIARASESARLRRQAERASTPDERAGLARQADAILAPGN